MKSILVTTEYRGVYFGEVADDADLTQRTMELKNARCAIYWATTKGVAELAVDGPNKGSRIGVACDVLLHGITGIWTCSEKAVKAWTK